KEFSNFFLENFDFCKVLYILTSFVPGGAWQQATFTLGSIVISWGAFLGSAINFIIIAPVVFIIAKILLGKKKYLKSKILNYLNSKHLTNKYGFTCINIIGNHGNHCRSSSSNLAKIPKNRRRSISLDFWSPSTLKQ
ncbi:MAG: hypothetical protein AABX94_01705, partial [Nanoarchaeota archaeon]